MLEKNLLLECDPRSLENEASLTVPSDHDFYAIKYPASAAYTLSRVLITHGHLKSWKKPSMFHFWKQSFYVQYDHTLGISFLTFF